MKKLILTIIFTIVLFTGLNSPVLKAAEIKTAGIATLQTASDDFVYVKVLEDGVWWIYIYTTDGIFVAKVVSV